MTRRIFFGLIPAVVAAAKWPIEKLRGVPHIPGVLTDNYDWGKSFIVLPAGTQYKPTGWLEEKLRSEMEL